MATNNAINLTASGLAKYDGAGAFSAVTVTNHNVLLGAASNGITSLAPSATSGVPLISQGSSADPAFGTAVVAGGGTGQVTLTNHGVLIGQATSAIAATAAGSAGQVLQSGGASADPTYSTATYPATAGTSGNVLTSDGTNWISSAPAGGSFPVQVQTTSITSAQIKAIRATPITVATAPGAGFTIIVLQAVALFTYGGSNAFTNGMNLDIQYATIGLNILATPLISSTEIVNTSSLYLIGGAPTHLALAATDTENKAIQLKNFGASEITGNASNNNTLKIQITYVTVATLT